MLYKRISYWVLSRPKRTGYLFFTILFVLNCLIVVQRYQLFKENKSREVRTVLDAVATRIDQSLKNCYNVALTLGLTINDDGIPVNFEEVAKNLMKSNTDFQALELVPDGVIKYIYPLKGNEQALNLNLFKGPLVNKLAAQKAIDTRAMYFEGPIRLKQGDLGVIGRMPIFINDQFWGFSAVVIKLDVLLKSAGIDNERFKDYKFQLSKDNIETKIEEHFLPVDQSFLHQEKKSIVFADGDWKLTVSNVNPYDTWLNLLSAIVFGLGLTLLSSYLLTKLLRKQALLQVQYRNQGFQLAKTESKFKKIFDFAAVGIATIDSKTGKIKEANQYFCNLFGYNLEELAEIKIKSLIFFEDLDKDMHLFKRMLSGELKQFQLENRYISKFGKLIWGSVTITPLWKENEEPSDHIIIIEDITKRKVEERILVESQKRIESLINTIDGVVWEGSADSIQNTYISNKVTDILGYSPKEWMNTKGFWENCLFEEDKEWVLQYVNDAIRDKKSHDFEYRIYKKNGEIVWIRDIVNIVEEANQPVLMRGIMFDVTNKKEAADALAKSFDLVTDQNKRLLNFSYIVSHNLRSHASNIKAITGFIESASNENERKEMIAMLKTVANNLDETLHNLNHIVSVQNSIALEVEPLALNEYVNKAIITQNAQITAKNALIVNQLHNDIHIHHNKAYLESIILNLLSNALRYSHPDRQAVIHISAEKMDNYWLFEFADNGIGIDLGKHSERLFGIYQTFNGNADARGFGLFITKNQIEAMGGKIKVESELGVGTTFKVYFKA